jgi:hypothetical protein
VALSVDTRKIAQASVVPWEPGEYGLAWMLADGRQGCDRIGPKAQAETLLRSIGAERADALARALKERADA